MLRANNIRLVTFDALETIITPRFPVHILYANHFRPYLGDLNPDRVKVSFRAALKDVQREMPAYDRGHNTWWSEVIRRTALGAGANETTLDASLGQIVSQLMTSFSSKIGYKAFPDAVPTIKYLSDILKMRVAVISNADSRMRQVLKDFDFPQSLSPIVLSEEEKVEKPDPAIFLRALELVNREEISLGHSPIEPHECLHIGDDILCDYQGAIRAGMQAILIQRSRSPQAEGKPVGVSVVDELQGVVEWLQTSC